MKLSMFIVTVLVVVGCADEKLVVPSPEAPHRDEAEHVGLPKRVRLSPEVARDAGIATQAVTRAVIASMLSLSGDIVSDPDKTAEIAIAVTGRIAEVSFKEGQRVERGAPLVVIDVPEVGRLAGGFATAQTRAKAARANSQRLAALADKGLAAAQEVVNAEAEATALESEAQALTGQLRALGAGSGESASRLIVRSPISGTAVSRNAVVGQPIAADAVVATIADLEHVWFQARVFEKDLGEVREGAGAEVQLNAYPKERFAGVIDYVGKRVDPTARTVTARIILENRDGLLRLGLFGVAHVAAHRAESGAATLVVPRSAITDIAGKPVVFVLEADGDYEMHDVIIGDSGLAQTAILSGLREGEAVVTRGVFTLKSMILKDTFGEDE